MQKSNQMKIHSAFTGVMLTSLVCRFLGAIAEGTACRRQRSCGSTVRPRRHQSGPRAPLIRFLGQLSCPNGRTAITHYGRGAGNSASSDKTARCLRFVDSRRRWRTEEEDRGRRTTPPAFCSVNREFKRSVSIPLFLYIYSSKGGGFDPQYFEIYPSYLMNSKWDRFFSG